MENKVINAETRSERAVRRVAAALGFVIAAVMCIMLLTAYLKFKPEMKEEIIDEITGEIIQEASEGKLKQFLKVYSNGAMLKVVIFNVVAGILCFLPARLADISTFAVAFASIYVLYQKSLGNISKFPNGFMLTALCFFAAAVYCAVKRNQIFDVKGRKIKINPLIPISSAVMLVSSLICKKIVDFKYEYEVYTRFVDKDAEDFVEKDWGNLRPLLPKIDMCVDTDYISIAIVLAFVAVIILVLHNFPRLAAIAAGVGTFYTLYKITVGTIEVIPLPIFLITVIGTVCAIAAVSATADLKKEKDYADGELDENIDEDDEDELEYQDLKKNLEKNGLEMQDF